MARLEIVDFRPWTCATGPKGAFTWRIDAARRSAAALPQIYWNNGAGWPEANLWALERTTQDRANPATVLSAMRHLKAYADFLEDSTIDWRHFPIRRDERVLDRFRGRLLTAVNSGQIALSTASVRMNTVIRFYRFSQHKGFVQKTTPMWSEKTIVIPFVDNVGFQRAMSRVTTSLNIPNRTRPGITLEDGLQPISSADMTTLLALTSSEHSTELHLMLCLGFFSGARIGTIVSLTKSSLLTARRDPLASGFYLLPVGPGTNIATKFNVRGDLYIPEALLADLKVYASSTERLRREARATPEDKPALFITRRFNRYSVDTVDRLIQELRGTALDQGMSFMDKFRFHQSRATYGTWMMQLMLECSPPSNAIDFVRRAMLHKNESTTFRYVKFLETTAGKIKAADEFNEAFTGLRNRKWSQMQT